MAESAIHLRGISYAVGPAKILADIGLDFRAGRFNVLLGPNGAGKSSLMRVAAGRLKPTAGAVTYGDVPVGELDATTLARRRAVLSQNVELAFPLPVEDVVMMGRYPHFRGVPTKRDREIVGHALDLVDMAARRAQPYPTLSGGERQKTHLARVLAQIWSDDDAEGRVLFLDEPTTSLDIHYQIHLLDTARDFLARGCTIVASLHDINMAFDYGDHFFLMEGGRLLHEAEGALPKALIEQAYRVKADGDEAGRWRFRL